MGPDPFTLLFLVLMGATLFRVHLLGAGTFIGDSDRLNTFLNIRTFEVESIRHRWSMGWDPFMFMGFDMSGLHYMLIGADPIAYFEAMFPSHHLFRVAGYVSCLFLITAAWTAYFFIKDTTHHPFSAFVGAVLYSLSAFSVVRIGQVDPAFAVLICIPLGLLILRRLDAKNTALYFLLCTLLLSVMLLFTFLQETAYAIVLFGAYAIYRSLTSRSWRPLGILLASLCVAGTISFPRLWTVFQDFQLLDRTTTLQTTHWYEIFRWFNDGLFGRFPQEQVAVGNGISRGINLHEGLQLYTSTFAALLVLAGVLRFRGVLGSVATVTFLTVLGWILVPWIGAVRAIGLVVLVLLAHRGVAQATGLSSLGEDLRFQEADAPFHLYFLTFAFGVVLIEPVRYVFYLAFLKVDFTHSRISGTALLPMCTLASVFLRELFASSSEPPLGRSQAIMLCGSMALALGVLWLIGSLANGPLTARLLGSWNKVLPVELMKVFWATTVFVLFLVAIWVLRAAGQVFVRHFLVLSLGFIMFFQAFAYADFQLFGPHTWTFPIPFLDNNFFNVRPAALRPPSAPVIQAFHQRLEVDDYRSVLVADPRKFPAFAAPHISQFWRLRLVDGYGAGVPRRLAQLPWPEGVRSLRALSFADTDHLPWPLLSILNVKYAVVVDRALYYNLGPGGSEAVPNDVRVLANPLPVVPRAFFVRTARTVPSVSRPTGAATGVPHPPAGVYPTVVSSDSIILSWADATPNAWYDIERKESSRGTYITVGETGPNASSHASSGLKPRTTYYFRVRACTSAGCSAYSPAVYAATAAGGLTPPTELKAVVVSHSVIVLSWSGGTSSARYQIELKEGQKGGYLEIGEASPGTRSYRVSDLKSLTTYYVRVRACTARGCSPHSAEISAATPSSLRFSELDSILPDHPAVESIVEGFPGPARFSTEGRIRVHYAGATVDINVDPSTQLRFLVLDELYHPGWKAFAGTAALHLYPTNIVMQGLVVPPGVTHVTLLFVPFLHTFAAALILASGIMLLGVGWWVLRRFDAKG